MRFIQFKTPAGWLRLNAKQLMYVAKLLLGCKTRQQINTKAFLYFSGCVALNETGDVDNNWFSKGKEIFVLSKGQLLSLTNEMNWLHKAGEVNPLPWLRFHRARNRRMYDALFVEFLEALNLYYAFCYSGDEKHLNALCSILYPGFKRFDSSKVYERGSRFRKVKLFKRYTVMLWFSGLMKYIASECSHVFQSSEENENNEPVNVKQLIKSFMQILNEGDVTRNNDIRSSNMWDSLYELDRKMAEAETKTT